MSWQFISLPSYSASAVRPGSVGVPVCCHLEARVEEGDGQHEHVRGQEQPEGVPQGLGGARGPMRLISARPGPRSGSTNCIPLD